MAICKDNSITTLNKWGYDAVKYPKTGISPLDFVVKSDGRFTLITSLPKVWISDNNKPEILQGPIPGFNILESGQLKGNFGINALTDIFKAGLNLSGLKDKSIKLIVNNPKRIYCDFNDVANYILKGNVDPEDAAYDHFTDDKKRVFLILETIASSELKIIVSGKSEVEATVTAKEISESITANIQSGISHANESEITYNNNEQLVVFGFKQGEIIYENGWILKLPERAGNAYLGGKANVKYNLLEENSRISF